MSRFKSTLLRAGLLASLLSFGTGAAFAEAPNVDIRNGVQMPPAIFGATLPVAAPAEHRAVHHRKAQSARTLAGRHAALESIKRRQHATCSVVRIAKARQRLGLGKHIAAG